MAFQATVQMEAELAEDLRTAGLAFETWNVCDNGEFCIWPMKRERPGNRARTIERGNIRKHVATVVAQFAIFVIGKLAVIVARVLPSGEHVYHFIGRTGTTGCKTTALIRVKIAELTPIANASVNTATAVNPAP